MKELFSPLVDRVIVLVRSFGPYAAIELLLPGGSMVALLYWWYRQRVSRCFGKAGSPIRLSLSFADDTAERALVLSPLRRRRPYSVHRR